ncbi:MAG: ABC transporter ATP-binding protein [Anaerolineales bacterium]|nr:ABC transporter ATP-binding protein [Anaerolineales bacterium]
MKSTYEFPPNRTGSLDFEVSNPYVQMRQIWKRFPGVVANQGVDLDLYVNEVHALLGENGAGKTTLMRILSGFYKQDEGEIFVGSNRLSIASPADAIRNGIGMVHQNFRLVETLTVAENIHMGWNETPAIISASLIIKQTEEICNTFGLKVDPHAKVWQLSTGEQQRVEILRVLSRGVKILILDEPTSVLTPQESREIFAVLRDLAKAGHVVVFISHKLEEVLYVSDRVTILRDGRVVGSLLTKECDLRSLASLMVGDVVVTHSRPQDKDTARKLNLELTSIEAQNDRNLPALRGVSLKLYSHEILGIAGVAGNGQTELAEVITGLRHTATGSVILDGKDLTNLSPAKFAAAGIGHIPEDRLGVGLAGNESIISNAILREYKRPPISTRWYLSKTAAKKFAQGLVAIAGVRVMSVEFPIRILSGGNLQRILTRREMRIASRLLVAVHPSRGLDIGATEEVHRLLYEQREKGGSVLLISEDLDELLEVCDRIAVMYEGQIKGVFENEEADREKLGLLMGGATLDGEGIS